MNGTSTQSRALRASALAAVLGLLTACSGQDAPRWRGGEQPKGPQVAAVVTAPAANAKNVPASAEIEFRTEKATSASVELKDSAGKPVEGELRPGGTSWMPMGQLEYGETYTATVTAVGAEGRSATATSTFTVMSKPVNLVRAFTNIGDDMVVGVGMPMVLRFGRGVPQAQRASVQRRLLVQTTPPQEGIWHWFSDTEVHYRPKRYWQAETQLSFRLLTGGLPLGGGWYGRSDLTVAARVGSALVMTVDNATKQMTVTENGRVVKTIPVSLGKPATPSSSGTMVVMEKARKTVFDTMQDPDPRNRYRIDIEYAQRLTWGGEFLHAAPWSVADQGRRNVSHGCVNMSMANAEWLFNKTKLGDPVVVKGTERRLQYGNGWMDWTMSWEEYVKGSAVPYEPGASAASAGPSPSPSG